MTYLTPSKIALSLLLLSLASLQATTLPESQPTQEKKYSQHENTTLVHTEKGQEAKEYTNGNYDNDTLLSIKPESMFRIRVHINERDTEFKLKEIKEENRIKGKNGIIFNACHRNESYIKMQVPASARKKDIIEAILTPAIWENGNFPQNIELMTSDGGKKYFQNDIITLNDILNHILNEKKTSLINNDFIDEDLDEDFDDDAIEVWIVLKPEKKTNVNNENKQPEPNSSENEKTNVFVEDFEEPDYTSDTMKSDKEKKGIIQSLSNLSRTKKAIIALVVIAGVYSISRLIVSSKKN